MYAGLLHFGGLSSGLSSCKTYISSLGAAETHCQDQPKALRSSVAPPTATHIALQLHSKFSEISAHTLWPSA